MRPRLRATRNSSPEHNHEAPRGAVMVPWSARSVGRVVAMLVSLMAAAMVAGCDLPEPTGPSSRHGELVALLPTPQTVWELIDRVAAAPPITLADGQALVKGPMRWPLGPGRYESTGADLSSQLRDVELTLISPNTGWVSSSIDVTVDRCVTRTEVRQRYPRLRPAGVDTPRPYAQRYLAQDEPWGILSVAFRLDTGCFTGLGMQPLQQ